MGDMALRTPEALWREYSALVRGVLCRSLGSNADVDDLVQDTFIGLIRTVPGLRDANALRAFVVGTALHVARTELRRGRVRRQVALTATGTLPDVAEEREADPEARRAVLRLCEVLDGVDARSRTAFVLRHVEGCDLTEVAATIGCSLATTKRVLARTRERVRMVVRHDRLAARPRTSR
jgi:RNA polymerase sigma-70 factor (ECF subfamily)